MCIDTARYYIRSAVRPTLFWFYHPNSKTITVSSQQQTKFIIRRVTPLPFDCPLEEDIFIGKDDINIFVHPYEWQEDTVGEMIVRNPQRGLLGASSLDVEAVRVEAGVFKFQMFDKGFSVWSAFSWEGCQVCVSSKRDGGERWEFVQ